MWFFAQTPAPAPGFDITQLLNGNAPMWLIIAFLVIMQIWPDLFKKKPVGPVIVDPTVPVVNPPAPVITVPANHPILNQLLQLLVQYGPILLPILMKQQQEDIEKARMEANR